MLEKLDFNSIKCISHNTRVFTSKGYLPISNLENNGIDDKKEFTVDVFNRSGIHKPKGLHKENSSKINILKLENGEEISGTDNLQILSLKNNKVNLNKVVDLCEGDYILFPKILLGDKLESDDNWAYLTGAWIANGFSTQYDCRFTGTKEQCIQFAKLANWDTNPLENINNLYFVHKGKSENCFSLKGTMLNKELPERLFSLSINSRVVFLKSLLEHKAEVKNSNIILEFKSKSLVKDLQELLHTLAITTYIDKKKDTTLLIPLSNITHLQLTLKNSPLVSKVNSAVFVDGLIVSKLFREHRKLVDKNKHTNDFAMVLANRIKETNSISRNDIIHYKNIYGSIPMDIKNYFYDGVRIESKNQTISDVYGIAVDSDNEYYAQGTINSGFRSNS